MKVAALVALALAVLVVPAAIAAGPTIAYTITSGTTGDNGWYRSQVTAQISVASAIDTSCPSVKTFRTSSDSLSCTATDGTSTIQFHLQFKIDTDAPTVTGSSPSRDADRNGWFNKPLSVTFSGSDATSGIASCTSASYGGPDTASGSVSGTCRDNAGNVSAPASFAVKYDATPPTATAAAARAPDANGWFNHAVPVAFSGTDATSGIDSCTGGATYGGPDTAGTTLVGTCTDQAGNQASAQFALKYDATKPSLAHVDVQVGNGDATVSWQQPPDTAKVEVVRTPGHGRSGPSPVYSGDGTRFRDGGLKPGVAYRYTLWSRDQAGNVATTRVRAQLRQLYAPAPGAKAAAGSALRWVTANGASYYNVQLFLKGHKVMSVWPLGSSYTLPRSWTFEGKKHRLARGIYRWYVWPGIGARSQAKYGHMLGGSYFRVA
jgi:hypothetical protein